MNQFLFNLCRLYRLLTKLVFLQKSYQITELRVLMIFFSLRHLSQNDILKFIYTRATFQLYIQLLRPELILNNMNFWMFAGFLYNEWTPKSGIYWSSITCIGLKSCLIGQNEKMLKKCWSGIMSNLSGIIYTRMFILSARTKAILPIYLIYEGLFATH